MKQVVYIKKEGGTKTPQMKADELARVAHLEAIINDPITGGTIKYYTMGALHDCGKCAEVTVVAGQVVSVRNVSEDVLRNLPPKNAPMFGGF